MQESQIVITELGMVSSVGLDAIQSCASTRAGISRFREWEGFYCQQERPGWGELEPVICASVPLSSSGAERITSLMIAAAREVIHKTGFTRAGLGDTAIFVSLPPDNRSGKTTLLSQRILREFYSKTGIEPLKGSKVFSSGHSGGLLAVQDAMATLQRGDKEFCMVVGADSYLETETLIWLDGSGRLKSERSKDAFIPGEGAAALLLERYPHAMEREAPVFAAVEKIGLGTETNTIGSDMPCTGEGLCEAIRQACTPEDKEEKIDWVVCDLNGESYRSREWGYCQVRLHDTLGSVKHLWHPADCIGDVGAATGTVIAALAARAFQRGYAPSDRSLLWTSSDNGDRAAMVLKKG
jgi:3-oxoacyl-[acyl-carrier-protein] synthase-1